MRAPNATVVPARRPTLATWVTPREHAAVLDQVAGRIALFGVSNIAEMRDAFATGRAHGAIASVARLDATVTTQLGRLHREFPQLPLVGLVTQDASEPVVSRAATLGRLGAEPVVDLRIGKHGWSTFNSALDSLPTPVVLRATALVKDALGNAATEGWLRFIATAFLGDTMMVKDVARGGGMNPSTFCDRFVRAKLPAPRQYMEIGFVARFAYLAEMTTWSAHAIAGAIDASSPQSLGRIFKRLTGQTAAQWRRDHGIDFVLADFSRRFIEPYLTVLRHFDPFQRGRRCAASL